AVPRRLLALGTNPPHSALPYSARGTPMLKKLLAGLTAVTLPLGMVALTAAPASATADDCRTFTRDDLTWNLDDQVVVAFQDVALTKPAGSHNDIAVSGSPSALTIASNGGTQDRTGQTVLNGDGATDIE